jgi:hypothetical protein
MGKVNPSGLKNTILGVVMLLAMVLATQVARVRFPVPARPTFRVEKVAFFGQVLRWHKATKS